MKFFAPDVDSVQARVLAAAQKPIVAAEFFTDQPFGEPAWKSLRSWYLITEQGPDDPA